MYLISGAPFESHINEINCTRRKESRLKYLPDLMMVVQWYVIAWLYFFKKSCWMLAPSFWTGIWWISKEKKVKFAPPPFFWLLYFVIWTVHPHSIDVITHCMRLQPTTSVISFYFFLKFPSPISGQPWSTAPPLFTLQDRLSQYTCWKSCAPPPISFFACSSRLYLTRQLPSWILADTLTASRGLYGGIVT